MIWKTTFSFIRSTIGRIKTYKLLFLILFIGMGFSTNTHAQCNSQNITLSNFFFGDAYGDPLDPYGNYQIGDTVNGYIYGTFGGNSTNGYSPYLEFSIFINGNPIVNGDKSYCLNFDDDGDGINDVDPSLKFNQIPKGYRIKLASFSWTYGDEISIKNFFMNWQTNTNSVCQKESRNSQCYGNPEGYIVRTPLVANFDYTQDCNSYVVTFDNKTTGGDPTAYEFSWDFGGLGTSTEENPSFDFQSAGDYQVSLTSRYFNTEIGKFITKIYTENVSVFEPQTASAGIDQKSCDNSSFTLAGNTPTEGTGMWSLVSGSATISTPGSATSSVIVEEGNTATLKWTITYGDNCTSSDEVVITNYEEIIANAGPDQSQCNNSAFTLAGNDPAVGTGMWTVVSGSATINNANAYNSSVTVPAGVTAVLKWTITNGDCSSEDTVSLTNYQQATTADAGDTQSQCNDSAFTLAGNDPAVGTGMWTVVSGSATITDPSSSTSSVTVPAGVTAVLKWTITNGDCSSEDTVSLTNYQQVTTADAGDTQSQCNNSAFTLAGNDPAVGTGMWTVVSGSATINNANAYNSSVTVPAGVTAVLKWTITNGDCSSEDTVSITNYQQATTADAGDTQSKCNDSAFTLAGNDPAVGTGMWTVVSGNATINNANAYNSSVTVPAGVTAVLKWTITNGDCSSEDTVSITNYQQATTADAGDTQSKCNDSAFTLAGNDPAVGTGMWTVVSGNATINNANAYNSSVTVPAGVTAVLKWTITNGDCSSEDTVSLTNYQQVTTAAAGDDQSNCNDSSFTLAGNNPTVGTGAWSIVSGNATITDPSSATSSVTVAAGDTVELQWTITNGDCSSEDTVKLTNYQQATTAAAGDDQSNCDDSSFTLAGNSPTVGTGAWSIVSGNATITDPSSATSSVTVAAGDTVELQWTITNGDCSSSDTVKLTNNVLPDAPISGGDQSVCYIEGQSLTATASVPDGYTVFWFDSSTGGSPVTPTLSSVGSKTYYAAASNDATECISLTRTAVTLEILPEITLTAEANTVTCNGAKDGKITFDSNGTVTIYNSSNADVTSDNGSLPAGIYTVVATETEGNTDASCSKELEVEIKVRDNDSPVISVPESIDVEICEASGITAANARFPLDLDGSDNILDSFTATGYSASDDQTVESITYIDVVDESGCMPVVTRTFSAKDNCGAESTAVMTINLIDKTKPFFNEPLPTKEITVECTAIPDPAELTAADECAGTLEVAFTENKEDNGDGCGNTFTITRNWAAEDCSGNMVSFTQIINVIDTTAPVFDQKLPKADITASCDDVPAAMELTATDACEGFVNVVYNESKQDDDECATNYTLVRTWTATDCAGNEASFTQTVHVSDTTKPEFVGELPAAEFTVECDNIPAVGPLNATDNCSAEVSVNFSEAITGQDDECPNVYTITRTWTAADCAGNEISHTQVINVVDTQAPAFNEAIPANMTMECENLPEPPTITATDNCDSNAEVTYSETSTKENETDKEYVVTRTWTATDCAGNETTASQEITIANTGAPSFNENLPGDITVECDDVPEAPVITASDNCVDEVEVVFSEKITGQDDDCANVYTITRTWTATDEAGNETSHTQVINVIDTTAPQFDQELPETNITAECSSVPDADTLTATDNCSGSVDVDYSEDITGQDDDCANTYTITRTWTAADCAGNETSFTQVIEVIDTTAPTFDGELPSETLTAECDNVPAAMTLTASDNCAETAAVSFSDEITEKDSDADNNYIITRTWIAADCAGNETTFVQTVTVEDTTAPVITSCPEPVNVSADMGVCSASGVQLGMPTATDNCNSQVSITNNAPEVFPIGETTVTWTVSDNAGNSSTCTQVVTVIDDQNPVVETMQNITVNSDAGICGAVVEFGMVGATDNCELESVEVTAGYTSGSVFPIGTTTVTWTVTDASGNIATSSFTVTVEDNESPEISCPGDMTVSTEDGQNYAVVEFADATATDNCEVSVEQTGGPVSGSQFPIGTTVVTFTATDASGNTSECSFKVTVEDNENPTIDCPDNIDTNVDGGICGAAVEFTAPQGMDNSGNVTVEQTAGPASGEVFPVGTTTVTFTATDEAGNTAECSFTVTVKDDEAPVIEDKDDITVNVDPDTCGAVVEYTIPQATDNCAVDSVVLTEGMESGSEFPVGTTKVTYVTTDNAGNTASSSFNVTVIDNIAPTIQCPGDIDMEVARGTTTVVVEYTAVTTTDNCDGTTVEMTSGIASGGDFPLGTTKVTYTVTDAAGNTATCSFNVNVTEEALPPVPDAPEVTITQAICADPFGMITVTNIEEGITYSIDGENYQAEGIFTNLAPGPYQVTAKDEFGQVSEATTVTIEEPTAAVIETTTTDLCVEDASFNLFDLLLGEYDTTGTWIDTENTGALTTSFIDPSMLEVGTYTFEYQLEGNCPSTTQVTVSINDDCVVLPCTINDIRDGISKVVTPNGDMHNDTFVIQGNVDCGFIFDVKIFNRWGAKVFDAKNYQDNWNGYSEKSFTSSNQLPAGTYYYVVEVRNSEFKPITGYIYLGTK
ncbi:hypothetical protein C7S20_13175 [Christiangramia fulva]|uniref:HYR domain-containing protein n=1 Tax=Christiangramia fulva TaxID=2126553 RepID=A0A2R3Z7E9_9FLAO|nr:HYR domain-containing protein [Christiangramia fulva]AVR46132.1 hypothetical protein C7S20_13175 [Christiangramia fulva]